MITPNCSTAYKLLCQGENALSQVSVNGFKIDRDYYMKQKPLIEDEVRRLKKQVIEESEIGRAWQRRFQSRMNLDSADQLKTVLKNDMQFDKFKTTEKGGESADKSVVEKLPYEFSNPFLRYKQLNKAWGSLITPIMLGADENGFTHPNINLHTVRTFRSSCDSPNLQQVPKHNEFIKKLVRGGFVPRNSDRFLAEIDLVSAEVACGCCLHQDKQMLEFLHNPSADMHKFVAKKFYELNDDEFTKKLRSSVKGRFVFASFYGASYNSIGSSLWEYIDESGEVCGTGETLKDHMAKIGVADHESCLQHAEKVFDWYWHDLFAEYGAWKEEVWQIYKRQGYLDYPTGFRVTCQMTKTQAMNTIIQGSTFHLLLYTLVELQKRFVKYKLKSKIVCQIHDSIVLDVVPSEWDIIRQLYLEAQASVREVWKWLIYPISADAEVGDVGGSWAKMNEYGALAS